MVEVPSSLHAILRGNFRACVFNDASLALGANFQFLLHSALGLKTLDVSDAVFHGTSKSFCALLAGA